MLFEAGTIKIERGNLYKVEIFKLFFKAYNDILLECLSKSILVVILVLSCYSLRGQNVALIPKCNSRLMRDSLAFRGSVLWNLVNYNDKITNSNFKEIKAQLTVVYVVTLRYVTLRYVMLCYVIEVRVSKGGSLEPWSSGALNVLLWSPEPDHFTDWSPDPF